MDTMDILYGDVGKRRPELEQELPSLPAWVDLGPYYFEDVSGWSGTERWVAKIDTLPKLWTKLVIFAKIDSDPTLISSLLQGNKTKPVSGMTAIGFDAETGEVQPADGGKEGERRYISLAHKACVEHLRTVSNWSWDADSGLVYALEGEETVGVIKSSRR